MRTWRIRTYLAMLCAWLGLSTACAQPYPTKPLRIIVPFAAGGGSDVFARLFAPKLNAVLGQPVLVENRTGANGMIGAELVAKAPPDGQTLLLMELGSLTISASLVPKLGFDPFKDLVLVSTLTHSPHLLVTNVGHRITNVKELIETARAKPNSLNFATPGTGSAVHLISLMFARNAGIEWTNIPYKGSSQALADVIGGQADVTSNSLLSSLPFLRSGKLRALATTGRTRSSQLPDVPTMIESGLADFVTGSYQAFLVTGGTPQPVLDRLSAEILKLLRDPEILDRIAKSGADPAPQTLAEARALFKEDVERWRQVIVENSIKLE